MRYYCRKPLFFLFSILCLTLSAQTSLAQEQQLLGSGTEQSEVEQTKAGKKPSTSQQYTEFRDENLDQTNIRTPEASMPSEGELSILRKILWYLPNRVIDLVDIVKIDVGVGSSAGGLVRLSRYGQIGARYVHPLSVRVGMRGRELPFFFERESEYGFCSSFNQSEARHVTPLEIGIGADLGIGAYIGVSIDELADFLLGFFFLDLKHDDLVPMLEP